MTILKNVSHLFVRVLKKLPITLRLIPLLHFLYQYKKRATLKESAGYSKEEYDLKKRGIYNRLVNITLDAQKNEANKVDQLAERQLSDANFRLDTHNIALMRVFPNVIPKGNSCFREYGNDPKKGIWTKYNVPKSTMPYKELVALKDKLDWVTRMVWEDEPSQEQIDSGAPHMWDNLQRLSSAGL